MNLCEESFQLHLQCLVFCSLIKLADKMSTRFEHVKGKFESSAAQVLNKSETSAEEQMDVGLLG